MSKKEKYKRLFDVAPELFALSEDTLDQIMIFLANSNLDTEQKNKLILLIDETRKESYTLGQYAG